MRKILISLFFIFLFVGISTAQEKAPQYNITYTYTGCSTIWDQPSHGTPQSIYMDPNNPDRIHAVCIYMPNDSVTARRTRYYYSTNKGTAWTFVADVPPGVRSGYSVITLMSNGNPLISSNTNYDNSNFGYRTQWFLMDGPGLGTFTCLYAPWYGSEYHWPRTVAANNITMPYKFVTIISSDAMDSAFMIKNVLLNPSPGTFTSWQPYPFDIAEPYSIARGVDGRIGIAYKINGGRFLNDCGSVFFVESTDNGTTFGSSTKIFSANLSPTGDSLSMYNSIQLVYQGNIPKVIFEVVRAKNKYDAHENDGSNHIRFWSSSLPGSDPNRSIKIADTSLVGYHQLKLDWLNNFSFDNISNICRPTIGTSITGNRIFVAFMVASDNFGVFADTVTFMDMWFMYSSNGGSNWVPPVKINPASPIRDWTYPSISIYNDNTASEYFANILMLSDSVPGSYANYSGNGISFAKYMFVRIGTPAVGISNINSNIPGEYKLYQNYPNPFNPSTIIKFQIPKLSSPNANNLSSPHALGGDLVTLKIYDILGKEVATLVNEKLSPGTYEIPFSISQFSDNQLSSGIYFYKLETDNFTDTKRMLMIK
ncbi:MAG: T9SS type A sorting domain-containing protein [Ignavibacteriae bacterium]|nr:T9SS type A sorting domain-containing protein [Ignavibacteriota bacterium]